MRARRSVVTETLAYWIQRTEVTNAQYGRCVEAGKAGEKDGCKPPADGNIRYQDLQFAKQPVLGVDWDQAQAYAAWVGGRLPTAAEWEKACRGGRDIPEDPLVGWGPMKRNDQVDRPYPWGNRGSKRRGSCRKKRLNFAGTGLGTWSAVGTYPSGASPYGALDMAGNVWEWTADWYKIQAYTPDAGFIVMAGGSFDNNDYYVRCAVRNTTLTLPANRYFLGGFRVVVSRGS